jgi:hypothetical protein
MKKLITNLKQADKCQRWYGTYHTWSDWETLATHWNQWLGITQVHQRRKCLKCNFVDVKTTEKNKYD